jgi:DNA-binding transcriptional LysR family regulator
MEWQQLEYFQMLARFQHVTRAARELHVSQPALSRALATLEHELGVQLFDREGRSMHLNRYGHAFLARVDNALEQIALARRELQDLDSSEIDIISLGFVQALGMRLVPELVSAFRALQSNVTFQLRQDTSAVVLNWLRRGEVDLGLCAQTRREEGVGWADLASDELLVEVPPGHALAGTELIKLVDIANEPLICLKPGDGLRQITDELCHVAGFSPRIAFEGDDLITVRGLVAAGLGVSIVPASSITGRHEATLIHVSQPRCVRVIGMAWIEDRPLSPATEAFKAFVLDQSAGKALLAFS